MNLNGITSSISVNRITQNKDSIEGLILRSTRDPVGKSKSDQNYSVNTGFSQPANFREQFCKKWHDPGPVRFWARNQVSQNSNLDHFQILQLFPVRKLNSLNFHQDLQPTLHVNTSGFDKNSDLDLTPFGLYYRPCKQTENFTPCPCIDPKTHQI